MSNYLIFTLIMRHARWDLNINERSSQCTLGKLRQLSNGKSEAIESQGIGKVTKVQVPGHKGWKSGRPHFYNFFKAAGIFRGSP